MSRAIDTGSPEILNAVAEEYPNTVSGQMADVLLGDFRLSVACQQRFVSRVIADRELKAAQESYLRILDKNL